MTRDVLVLRTDRFSLENAPGLDLPLGVDLAEYLRARIEQRHRYDSFLISKEDYGSVLSVRHGRTWLELTITWYALETKPKTFEDVWLIQFGQSHGCITLFWTPADNVAAVQQLKELVGEVVEVDQRTFGSHEWWTKAEFDERV